MANVYGNRIKVETSTTGTGTITLGSAVSGFQTFANGGISDGNTVAYTIEDGANFEIGTGTYTSSGTTLSRSVTESSNSDSAINLSGNAVVFVTPRATDLPFTDGAVFTAPITVGNGSTSAGSVKFLEDSDNGTNGITLSGPASTSDVTFTLPSADGSANTFLKTDGSGNLAFAAAGADLYAANESSPGAQPSATGTNAIAIGDGADATGTRSISLGNTSGNNATDGIAMGNGAYVYTAGEKSFAAGDSAQISASYSTAIGRNANVSSSGATNSTALGYNSKTADGAASMALGNSYASGASSFAVQNDNNGGSYGAQGANSAAIGNLAKATGSNSVAIGGATEATDSYTVAMGYNSTATGYGSISIGNGNRCVGAFSVALGAYANSKSMGKFVYASDYFVNYGDTQTGIMVLHRSTTNDTATVLTSTGLAPSNNDANNSNQLILLNESVITFTGTVACREDATDGDDFAGWEVKGVIMRKGQASDTELGVGIVNTLHYTSALANASVSLSADTTNGGLKVEVTGVGSTNLNWVCTLYTSEVQNT